MPLSWHVGNMVKLANQSSQMMVSPEPTNGDCTFIQVIRVTQCSALRSKYLPVGGRLVRQLVQLEEEVVPRVLQLHKGLVRVQQLPVL